MDGCLLGTPGHRSRAGRARLLKMHCCCAPALVTDACSPCPRLPFLPTVPTAPTLLPPSPIPREFLELGFKYDNLLMEESAQILEIETFIPMLLQVKGAARLWQGRCWVQFCGRASAAA